LRAIFWHQREVWVYAHVDIGGEVCPDALHSVDHCLTSENTLRSDFEGHTRDFPGKDGELFNHGVDRVLEHGHLAFGLDLDRLGQISLTLSAATSELAHPCDCGCDAADGPHLRG
jgi:hypothetical protein